ncbi:hypothetical protein J1614_011539 [Plenodomus biglobosus]|nr:hypothetical protein J1614_011539 [Plenodomus biglobosus]
MSTSHSRAHYTNPSIKQCATRNDAQVHHQHHQLPTSWSTTSSHHQSSAFSPSLDIAKLQRDVDVMQHSL